MIFFFFFQAEDGIRDYKVTGVQTCALPICCPCGSRRRPRWSTSTGWPASAASRRSEEHTSELQSPCNLVCRLLLEKKKKRASTSSARIRNIMRSNETHRYALSPPGGNAPIE